MSKWFAIVMAWVVVASFAAGCADVSKASKVKCAGCEQAYDIHEGPMTGGDRQ